MSVAVASTLAPDALERRIGPWGEHALSSFGTRMAGAPTQHLASLATFFSELNVATVPPHDVSDAPDSIGRSIGAASSDSSLMTSGRMAARTALVRQVPLTAEDFVYRASRRAATRPLLKMLVLVMKLWILMVQKSTFELSLR